MTPSTCRGIDVSEHQVPQDWAAHRRDGVAFGFAKASEGEHSHDSRFARHISGIVAAQLLPGSYHFAWPNQDPQAEAANYIGAARPYAAVQPLYTHWLDLEVYPDRRNYAGRSAAQIRAWVTTWTAAVRAAFPEQRVGIYTSGDDLAAGHVPDGLPLWYPAYPWGAADYPRAETAAQPRPAGRTPLLWQFTSTPLDRSIAYRSEAALRAWAAGTTASTIEEDPVPDEVNLGIAKPYELAPGAWDSIEFTTEWNDTANEHAAGGSVFVRGACRFTGSVSLRINGLPVGETVQVRMSEYEGERHIADHPIDEAVGTRGDTFHVTPLTKHLAAGRGMRVRLFNNGGTPVTVRSAVLTALFWPTT
ncbi:glycoside hydrolase family 25 protein [Streptomyces sp. NPDC048279]|uniref:glycoside hydrolase family 25 protein n=1 Tax=Streptomyces sp. NPDC048279 TaxID=3154714 RepID=UPI00343A4063